MIERTPLGEALSCLACNRPGPALDPAHVIPRSVRPDLKDDPSNKVPLCRKCHDSIDRTKEWSHRVKDGYYEVCVGIIEEGMELLITRVPVEVSQRYGCLVRKEVVSNEPMPSMASSNDQRVEDGRELAIQSSRFFLEINLTSASDEELADLFDKLENVGGRSFLMACAVCAEFKRRYHRGGQSWVAIAREYVTKRPSTLYLYSEVWDTWSGADARNVYALEDTAKLHRGTLQIVAQASHEKREDFLNTVLHRVAETGECRPAEARRIGQAEGFLPPPKNPRRYTLADLRNLLQAILNQGLAQVYNASWLDKSITFDAAAFLDCVEEQEKDSGV